MDFVIGYAYVNHYENGVHYTCSYWKFTQLSHGTIRIDLSFIVFEESMIYYNNVIKNCISANFNSLYWTFFSYLRVSEHTVIKYIIPLKNATSFFTIAQITKQYCPVKVKHIMRSHRSSPKVSRVVF